MKKQSYNVAVAGATGAVGNEMVSILEQRNFPVNQLKLLASTRGAGTRMEFKGKPYTVEVMDENSFSGIDIGLFSPGGSVSQRFAPIAGRAGCVVIDNTSAFRMDPDVPLVVPEVNAHAI
ncbi:MAG: aspartate-semialdehyde dehydrogenase, partial [Deltaproteobacteria bacterium]